MGLIEITKRCSGHAPAVVTYPDGETCPLCDAYETLELRAATDAAIVEAALHQRYLMPRCPAWAREDVLAINAWREGWRRGLAAVRAEVRYALKLTTIQVRLHAGHDDEEGEE